MSSKTAQEIEELTRLPVGGLLVRYHDVFGERSRTNNRVFLVRRIAWRLQALAEGDLSERARARASQIANDADLRVRAPKTLASDDVVRRTALVRVDSKRDPRLPKPGTVLTREYGSRTHAVTVLKDGFEYEGRRYAKLSPIAREITSTRWNGFTFFGLRV